VNLRFIRLYAALDTCWQFAMKTDVWVFSDLDGLLYLKKSIRKAIKAKHNIHLDEVETDSVSMQCVILPALKKPATKPRLKIVERKIFKNAAPEMELVILGNKAGYKKLVSELNIAIKQYLDNPTEHLHIDDLDCAWVVPRSVSLNIRGPVSAWDKDLLGDYFSLATEKTGSYLPENCDAMTKEIWEYENPVVGEGPYILK
jgi:hypothetical protein